MTVHLIKLAVGAESLSDLARWQTHRLNMKKRNRQPRELIHITRQTPRRAEEILEGGSLYWVIKGWVVARQRLLELRPVQDAGMPHCGLVYDPEIMMVKAQPRRPFQGWRYLEADAAPKDLAPWRGVHELPGKLQQELMALGLM